MAETAHGVTLHHDDCLKVMRGMESDSVDLIATDPPYFKVKADDWDRQWDKPQEFLRWVRELCIEWRRILRPNGSLYVFASPQMAARVECEVGEWFSTLPSITWVKGNGWHQKAGEESLRSFFPQTERIIFAEHFNADNIALGETGYAAKCDELRGFVFEPIRSYLEGERQRAGVTKDQINEACGFAKGGRMAGHYFARVQWQLPRREHYETMRHLFNSHGGEYLRKEYEELREEYEELRRPFSVSADVPYTDVWTFPTVAARPGKHPCEKPLDMMKHIVSASSREGATVLDCFMGSGTTGEACIALGREFIGIEKDDKWFNQAFQRLQPTMFENYKVEVA